MIHITISQKDKFVQKIVLKGHAEYAKYGKDIVCAGVSSILTTTVNGILSLEENAITYQSEEDEFILTVNSKSITTQKLIQNMISLLKELEQEYPKNVKVESEEKTC